MSTKRRHRLIPRGGVEIYEVRMVTSIAPDGAIITNAEVTMPDGTDEPSLTEVLGAIRLTEINIVKLYTEED